MVVVVVLAVDGLTALLATFRAILCRDAIVSMIVTRFSLFQSNDKSIKKSLLQDVWWFVRVQRETMSQDVVVVQ